LVFFIEFYMTVSRRELLLFFGAIAGVVNSGNKPGFAGSMIGDLAQNQDNLNVVNNLGFKPVRLPLPLITERIPTAEQIAVYRNYEVRDDLVLPEGFTYDVIAAWGEPVGDSRFGYNNDYLSFRETAPNEGLLTVNFEYLSGKTWMATYASVIGKKLPLAAVKEKIKESEGEIDAFSLGDRNPLKNQIKEISREGLIDRGIGVIGIKRDRHGRWERNFSALDRRITGISGLDDLSQSLKSTGAATAIFIKQNKLGYEDNLGDRIIGTFQNCAGGTTPWGTVLSAEENFQDQVPEAVMADGSSMSPGDKPFILTEEDVDGNGNVFGLAGNKYGWMVEIDPANPNDYGTKHTWLGRYRHEAFGIRALAEKNLAVYSGCDRRSGHLYKFISSDKINNPQDKNNSRLFEAGILYGAKFYPNGIGEWIPLSPDTIVNPVKPSQVAGGMVQLPQSDRAVGGIMDVTDDLQIQTYQQQFKTLGDLYQGNSPTETQGAILIDAHFAATAAGITHTSRPEDTIVAEDGTLFIAFTSGSPGDDGGPDLQIFQGPNGETGYEYGWIMKLIEDESDPAALSFTWEMLATGGEPALGGAGFANPDNLTLDRRGNLWMVTDMSTSKHNQAVPTRNVEGKPISGEDLTGVFGNNTLWYLPLSGELAGEIYPFAIGPMECECTGPMFDRDETNLFLSIQHPGENSGIRQNMATEARNFELLTTDGQSFPQKRQVPIGSNWPDGRVNLPPRPAVVAIRRTNGRGINIR
jgi:uncharacterized protein